jgi:SOS response regulatory protein OraA/RecX
MRNVFENSMEEKRCAVVSLRPTDDGARVCVRVKFAADDAQGKTVRTFVLRVEDYADLNFRPTVGGELNSDQLATLSAAAEASEAYCRGVRLLGYGANSAVTLERKLQRKGYDAEVAQRAVEALSARGYLREERDACRLAQAMVRRGRGLRRVLQELRARGYGESALAAVRESLQQEDFAQHCLRVLRAKTASLPADRQERQKLIAYLLRCGFASDQIRQAMHIMSCDE